jgi:hypothetical protein
LPLRWNLPAAGVALLLVLVLCPPASPATGAGAGGEGLPRAAAAPPWAVGSAWTWTIDQEILFSDNYAGSDVVVNHVSGSMADTLAELTSYNGTQSYRVESTYALTLTGNYTAGFVKYPFSWPVNGNGTTYYRIPDLATVRAVIHFSANLGVIGSTTFDSTADASPPAGNFKFPLDAGSGWSISTSYTTWEKTTGALGSTENSNVTALNYDASVAGTEQVAVPAGTLDCWNITYTGTSTTDGGSPQPYHDAALYCEAATNLALRRFSPLSNLTVVFGLSAYSLNHSPSVVHPLPAVSFEQGTAGSLDLSTVFSDPDAGDSLTFTAANYTHVAVALTAGTARLTAETGWTGTEAVLFSATDRKGAAAEAAIPVTVTPVSGNRNPPVATCSTHMYSIAQGARLLLDLSQRFTDPDMPGGDTLTFSVEGLPGNISVTLDSRTGALVIEPPAGFSGMVTFTARATDSTYLSASETIGLLVLPPNRPPVIRESSPLEDSLTIPEDSSQDFTADAVDPDGDELATNWTLDGLRSGTGRGFTYRPGFGTAGAHRLVASASDGLLSVQRAWDITVTHVNRPPAGVAIISPQDGALVKRGARVNFIGEGSDPDSDPLTFTWKDTNGRVLGVGQNITLANLTKGNHVITLEASDGQATENATALVTVTASSGGSTPGFLAAALMISMAVAMLAALRRKRR